MKTTIAIVLASTVVLAAGLAQAAGLVQTNGGSLLNQNISLGKFATCQVAGTPSEFPNDIWLTNKSISKLNAGTKIQWSIPGYAGYQGTHTLVAALNPGQGVHLLNVLPNGVEAGHNCKAVVS